MLIMHIERETMLKWVFVLVVIVFAIHMGRLTHSRLKAKEALVSVPIPYTVILKETVYRPDGSVTKGVDMTQAVRSDGSFVWRLAHERGDETKNKKQRIIRFASGIEVTLNEITNTKSTVEKNVNPARWQRDPSSKCINSFAGNPMANSTLEVINGEEMVAGYRTVKITRDNATMWFALDCGCAMVKDRMDWGSQGASEKNLVALVPGEPEAALFDVPATAKEAPPSEMMLGSGKDPKDYKPSLAEKLHRRDAYYYAHRPKR